MTRATSDAGDVPGIAFVTEAERCPVCNGALRVYKSRSRQVITLAAGSFRAIETLKQCGEDSTHPLMGSNALARQVVPRQRYSYDLIVHVGCTRYLHNQQRGEIQAELFRQRGITLSTDSLSSLCDRFLTYLEALHLARVPQLRAALGESYPLHIDATCEHGKGGLFVCMDGWRGWVLVAGRIPSEHADHLRPLVEKTTRLFGDPIATVRDMGKGGANAVAPLHEKGITDLICHYHFLAAVGKKLFEQPYALLRKLLKSSKVRTDVRAHQRELAPLEARRLDEIEAALREYRAELEERIASEQSKGARSTSPSTVIMKYLDRYGERLFGHPTRRDEEGKIVAIVERTNNVPEHFFGHEKQHLRRRLGRANLGRDLEDQPAQAALAANLRHPEYVRVLCGSLDYLPTAFAELDEEALEQTTPLSRSNRDSKLQQRIRVLLKGEKSVVSETDRQESNRCLTR